MSIPINFDSIPEVIEYRKYFLDQALEEVNKLKDHTIYSRLLYQIEVAGSFFAKSNQLKSGFRGIKPRIRQNILSDRESARPFIKKLADECIQPENFIASEDIQCAYDIADGENLVDPYKAIEDYRRIDACLKSGSQLIAEIKSEDCEITTYFLDPEVCYKIIQAETVNNFRKSLRLYNVAKKIAEWLQPHHSLLSVLSFCQVAKSQVSIGLSKEAYKTLFKASSIMDKSKCDEQIQMIASGCIAAVLARVLPECRTQIFREFSETIKKVDNVVTRILAYTVFVETLNPGRSFPIPITIHLLNK